VFPEDRLERNTIQEWNLIKKQESSLLGKSTPFSHPFSSHIPIFHNTKTAPHSHIPSHPILQYFPIQKEHPIKKLSIHIFPLYHSPKSKFYNSAFLLLHHPTAKDEPSPTTSIFQIPNPYPPLPPTKPLSNTTFFYYCK
jgi:hypothetical protein